MSAQMTRTHDEDTPTRLAERRRPGRVANPSPELIALMRKPSRAAEFKVMLYDAPNFVLPPSRPASAAPLPLPLTHLCLAAVASGGVAVAVFKLMLWAWN